MRTTSSNYCKLGATALAALLALGAGSASAQISDDVVRVGIQGDMSGPYSGNGGPGSVLAARMAVEDFGGKVNGKAIEIVINDDQNKPDVGLNAARKWLDSDKVDAFSADDHSFLKMVAGALGSLLDAPPPAPPAK